MRDPVHHAGMVGVEEMIVQTKIMQELIVDNFAGGGGASTGMELATGRPVDIAVNHDRAAIIMHKTNHPYTRHIQASVWDVDPIKECGGNPVGLAWFSPDCKHFSKAKGAAPVDRNIRGLAWIVLRWAAKARPRVIILENVEEFQTWGPVKRGKPVKSKSGQTFRKWKQQLSDLGYAIEHRELVAADYGAPTIRKRFFLVARCDGKPIVWPEPTHAKNGANGLKPWRSAAEIINWAVPCPSIFASKSEIKERYGINSVRPLADNTLRRVIRGVDKFTIKSGKPFIAPIGYGERGAQQPRINSADHPLNTIVSTTKQYVCAPNLIQYHTEQTKTARVSELSDPLNTVDASNRFGLVSAYLAEYYGNAQDALDITEPLHTVTTKDREALTLAHPAEFKGQDIGQPPDVPLRTITASIGEFAAINTTVVKYDAGANMQRWPKVRELLNRYCNWSIGENEVLLLEIDKTRYLIADIGLRMLTPRELYNAQGFPPDYIIDRDYTGAEYGKTQQVARCGNAVCPPLAEATTRANYESAATVYTTMAQLLAV